MLHFIITTLDSNTLCVDSDSYDITTTTDLYDVVTTETNIPHSHYYLSDNDHRTLSYHSNDANKDLLSKYYSYTNIAKHDDNKIVDDVDTDGTCIIFLRMNICIMGGIDFQHREGSKIGSG